MTFTGIKIYHAVSLQIISLAWSKLSALAAGDSQTTPVQIMHALLQSWSQLIWSGQAIGTVDLLFYHNVA